MKNVRQAIGGLGNLMFKQAYLMAQVYAGRIPDVYVQGESYWKPYADQVKQMFSADIGPDHHPEAQQKVAVHIRRGDYLKVDNFYVNLWETDYYQRAFELFPTQQFLVFCKDNQGWDQDKEDRQWCRDFLDKYIKGRYELVDKDNTEVEDFNLMASCHDIIMANSSFSWWAAYMNPFVGKKVVCPSRWFVDGLQRTELLDSWIKI